MSNPLAVVTGAVAGLAGVAASFGNFPFITYLNLTPYGKALSPYGCWELMNGLREPIPGLPSLCAPLTPEQLSTTLADPTIINIGMFIIGVAILIFTFKDHIPRVTKDLTK